MRKISVLFVLTVILIFQQSYAQELCDYGFVTAENLDDNASSSGICNAVYEAQTFIPYSDNIGAIAILIVGSSGGPTTLEMEIWTDLPGEIGATMLGASSTIITGNGEATVYFDPPVEVTPGETYAFTFFLSGMNCTENVRFSDSNPYPDGGGYYSLDMGATYQNTGFVDGDIYFRVWTCPSLIPTLSQWGVIILSLFLIILGIVGIRQLKPIRSAIE